MDLEPKNRAETFYNRILNELDNIANGVSDDEDNDSLTPINRAEIYWTKMIEKLDEIADNADQTASIPIHICTAQEYNSTTGIPTIVDPDPNMFYLVPGGNASNLYAEWIYVNNAWEKFGSATIDLSNYATLSDLNDKIDEPNTEGTSGQVLTTDGNGGRTWTTVQTDSPIESGDGDGSVHTKDIKLWDGIKKQKASGVGSVAFGINTVASGDYGVALGYNTVCNSEAGLAEGGNTVSHSDGGAHVEGWGYTLTGTVSEYLGNYKYKVTGISLSDVVAGQIVKSPYGNGDFYYYLIGEVDNDLGAIMVYGLDREESVGKQIEIYQHTATGFASHSEGFDCVSPGDSSHAEGNNTCSSGGSGHAEGSGTLADGTCSHAEGCETKAYGNSSHAEGYSTKASGDYQHVSGKYNVDDQNGDYAVIVGIGSGENNRANGHTIDWNGNAWYSGSVKAGTQQNPAAVTYANDLVTKQYFDNNAAAFPSNPATGSFLVYNGSAWVAQTLQMWQGGNY